MLCHMGSMGRKIYNFFVRLGAHLRAGQHGVRLRLEVWCGIALDLAPSALGAIRHVAMAYTQGLLLYNIFTVICPEFRGRESKAIR
jgi:hypothetical protein